MGFEVRVDGVKVYELNEDSELISKIHLVGPAGEAGIIGSPMSDDYVDLVMDRRNPTDLDMIVKAASDAAREADEASGKVIEEPEAVIVFDTLETTTTSNPVDIVVTPVEGAEPESLEF